MITKKKADLIAKQHLSDIEEQENIKLSLLDKETIEECFGWVYFYNSEEYIETGNFAAMLLGNAPFAVDKYRGKVYVFGTAKPIENYISKIKKAFQCSQES